MGNTGRIYNVFEYLKHFSPLWSLKNLSWVLLIPKMLLHTFLSLSKSSLLSPLGFSSNTTPSEEQKHSHAGLSNTGTILKLCHTCKAAENQRNVKYSKAKRSLFGIISCFVCFMLPCSVLLTFTLRLTYAQAGPFGGVCESEDPFTIVNAKSEPFSCKIQIK